MRNNLQNERMVDGNKSIYRIVYNLSDLQLVEFLLKRQLQKYEAGRIPVNLNDPIGGKTMSGTHLATGSRHQAASHHLTEL